MIRRPPRSPLFPYTPLCRSARVQLDPSIDVSALPDLSHAERTVARALQVHGAYNIDVGGATMAFIFEMPREDRKSTRLNSSHANISHAVFCLKKKTILITSI